MHQNLTFTYYTLLSLLIFLVTFGFHCSWKPAESISLFIHLLRNIMSNHNVLEIRGCFKITFLNFSYTFFNFSFILLYFFISHNSFIIFPQTLITGDDVYLLSYRSFIYIIFRPPPKRIWNYFTKLSNQINKQKFKKYRVGRKAILKDHGSWQS